MAITQQAQTTAELRAGLSRLDAGVCLSIDWATYQAVVSVSGGTVPMPMVGTAPAVGDRVLVGILGNLPVCLGAVARPATGTVASTAANGKVHVTGDDGADYTVAYDTAYTPAGGHRVALNWAVPGGFVLGRLSSDQALEAPSTITAPSAKLGEATFIPTDSGTYDVNFHDWFTSQVWSSSSTFGLYFYGGQIASTIPDNAEILEIRLYVDSVYTTGNSPTIGLHSETGKAGAPSVSSAVTIPGGSGWKGQGEGVPLSFGDALKTGQALGLGTSHGGYHKWSPARTNNSGALYIRWRTP